MELTEDSGLFYIRLGEDEFTPNFFKIYCCIGCYKDFKFEGCLSPSKFKVDINIPISKKIENLFSDCIELRVEICDRQTKITNCTYQQSFSETNFSHSLIVKSDSNLISGFSVSSPTCEVNGCTFQMSPYSNTPTDNVNGEFYRSIDDLLEHIKLKVDKCMEYLGIIQTEMIECFQKEIVKYNQIVFDDRYNIV